MAGHLLFNSGSNESSLAPQFKWLDNTFNTKRPTLVLFYSSHETSPRADRHSIGAKHCRGGWVDEG